MGDFPNRAAGRLTACVAAMLALCLATDCTSADSRAASHAAQAQSDLDQGRLTDAAREIGRALAVRDDNTDYWALKARIDNQAGNPQAAFSDYEYIAQLDHGNVAALQALCELGPSAGSPELVKAYADQLLLLQADAPMALTAKGYVALLGGDVDQATALANRVLAQSPKDARALILKARALLARNSFAEAAAEIEKAPDDAISAVAKLTLLEQIYGQAHDRASYVKTVQRLAQAAPDDADAQLRYADLLYQDEQDDAAAGLVRQVMLAHPTSLHVAAQALTVWMNAGPRALDPARIVASAAGLSPLMKADYAQYADEIGRPDLALAILPGIDRQEPTAQNSNAKAAYAYALALTGHRAEAMAQLNAILDGQHDPDQPRALLARARLFAAAHDYTSAVSDARLLVANAPDDPAAYLALADILRASGSGDLGESTLRDGLRAIPDAPRLAARLAASLTARGDTAQAEQVMRDLARDAPMDRRGAQLQANGAAKPAILAS